MIHVFDRWWEMTFLQFVFFPCAASLHMHTLNTNTEIHFANMLLILMWGTSLLLHVTSVLQKLTSSQSSKRLDSSVRVKHIACTHAHTHICTVHSQRLWWVKLRVANYSLGKVLPFCSSSALFGKSRERETVGGGLMGGGRRLLSLGIRPLLFLDCMCSSCTLPASGPLQQPPPPKHCLLPLLTLCFFLGSQAQRVALSSIKRLVRLFPCGRPVACSRACRGIVWSEVCWKKKHSFSFFLKG